MKHVLLLSLSLAAFLTFPSPANPSPASPGYTVYTVKYMDIFSISFQGAYTWYTLGQSGGALREDTRDGSLKFYTRDDGLPDNTIHTVFADSKGVLWFGTGKGVSRYDGAAWTHFNVDTPFQAGETFDIREDENGVLWFATWNGVRAFDGTKWGVWRTELPGEITRCISIGKNGVRWFGTERGLARYNGTTWSHIWLAEYVSAVFEDSKGRTWVLYYNKNASDWKSGGHLALILNGDLSDITEKVTFSNNYVGTFVEASDSSIWCGVGRDFHVFDGVSWRKITLAGNRTSETLTSVAVAADGSLWFGGYGSERYKIVNGSVTYAPIEIGPVSIFMLSAAVDATGMKWFGSDRGLSRFDGTHWKTYYDRDGISGNRINALATSGSVLWCGTDKGVSRFDGSLWKNYGVADDLPDSSVICLSGSSDGSTLWAGTSKGISRYDGKSWKTYTSADGLPDNRVNAVFLDNQSGTVYVGTSSGAVKFNGSLWTAVTASPDSITSILVDSLSHLWFGTNRGLLRFDGASWTLFSKGDGVSNLPDNTITALAEDCTGAIWAGTALGSVRFDGYSWTVDLRLDKVNAIAADTDGSVWFARTGYTGDSSVTGYFPSAGTNSSIKGTWTIRTNQFGGGNLAFADGAVWTIASGGVARIDLSTGAVRVFTIADGLPYYSVNAVASDGHTVWASSSDGYNTKSWISRWDGTVWSTFITHPGKLDRIASDMEGGIWAVYNTPQMAHGTVRRWDLNTGAIVFSVELQCQTIFISPQKRAWLPGTALYCAPDSIWNSHLDSGAYNQLISIDTPYNGKISSVVEDRNGVVWCGGRDYPFGVARYDGVSWKTYTTSDGLPTNTVNSLAAEPNGVIWAATPSGAARFDGKEWLTLTPNNSGLKVASVNKIVAAPDGGVWFSGTNWIASFVYDTSSSVKNSSSRPAPLAIGNVSPNPFNSSTLIRFTLPSSGKASLTVYDITGRKVRDLVSGFLLAGDHSIAWNGLDDSGRQVSSGVYFSRLVSGKSMATRKILLMK